MAIRTFRSTPEIEKLLEDIPYGKRGAFIKACIEKAAGEAIEKLEAEKNPKPESGGGKEESPMKKQSPSPPNSLSGSEPSQKPATTSTSSSSSSKELDPSGPSSTAKSKPNTLKSLLKSSRSESS